MVTENRPNKNSSSAKMEKSDNATVALASLRVTGFLPVQYHSPTALAASSSNSKTTKPGTK